MGWRNDSFGYVFKNNEIKLFENGHTWAMKLSQIGKQTGTVRIVTFSFPDIDYIMEQVGRRPENMLVICHSRFAKQSKTNEANVSLARSICQ